MSETKTAEDFVRDDEEMEAAQEELSKERSAKQTFDAVWKRFGRARKKGKTAAYAQLLQDLTENAAKLVPHYMTAKEFVSIISEVETHTKGDGGTNKEEPIELVSGWLRGDRELSRVPLDRVQ